MGRYLTRLCLMSFAVLLAACSSGKSDISISPQAAEVTQVKTAQGELIGFIAGNGAHVWRGVPYAADTSGQNRWRAPRPAAPWEGIRQALDFAPVCPQIATVFTPIESFINGELEGSEDCLILDIYAPENAAGKSLPVMLWIHGGSNVSGSSLLYVGKNLAVNEDVIIMSVQYRLGPMGWFSHPALVESAQTLEDKSANFGTLDLIAALKWVQANAKAFGGNPDNVTIFGESAGGHNVSTLLASPLAGGLFHRAIIQSGSFDSVTIDEARGVSGDLPNPSFDVTKRLGGPEKFHSASLAEVFAAFDLENIESEGFMDLPRIIRDGVVLPKTPLRNAFSSLETFNNVPIMSGTNKDEMKLFHLFDVRFTKTKFGQFIVAKDQNFYDAASDYSTRVWKIRSVDRPLAMMDEAGHSNVYGYRFDWDEGGKFLWMDLSKMLGAGHAVEIPFVLNRFKLLGEDGDKLLFGKKTAQSREKLSRAMGRYWASFARHGVPQSDGFATWPVFGSGADILHFDSDKDGGIRVQSGADSFENLARDLSTDTRLSSEQRCEIAQGLQVWSPKLAPALRAIDGCEIKTR